MSDETFEDDFDTEYIEPPEWMTAREFLELMALAAITDLMGRPSSLMRSHWRTHRRLVHQGYLEWAPGAGWGKHFAAVTVTKKAVHLLTETTDWRPTRESFATDPTFSRKM